MIANRAYNLLELQVYKRKNISTMPNTARLMIECLNMIG